MPARQRLLEMEEAYGFACGCERCRLELDTVPGKRHAQDMHSVVTHIN